MKCKELITRGKNKGKLCHEVNKYCNTPNHRNKEKSKEPKCQYCNKIFSCRPNVYRHEREHCPNRPGITNIKNIKRTNRINLNKETTYVNADTETVEGIVHIDDMGDIVDKELVDNNININTLNKTTNNINAINSSNINNINSNNVQQSINIICVGANDDFNKILSDKMGEEQAKNYILECAKNNLEGDINLLKKIYFEDKKDIEYPIKFLDRSRNKVEFIDENFQKVIDPKGLELGKRLCGNLQNGYLLHVNKILEANLNQQNDGKFLDEFDLLNCQNHIYELSSQKYRRMLLNAIPTRIY